MSENPKNKSNTFRVQETKERLLVSDWLILLHQLKRRALIGSNQLLCRHDVTSVSDVLLSKYLLSFQLRRTLGILWQLLVSDSFKRTKTPYSAFASERKQSQKSENF